MLHRFDFIYKLDDCHLGTIANTQACPLHANVSELVTAWPAVQAASGDASVFSTTSTRERPTNDPNVVVIWHTPTPPTDLMLARDIWEPTGL